MHDPYEFLRQFTNQLSWHANFDRGVLLELGRYYNYFRHAPTILIWAVVGVDILL